MADPDSRTDGGLPAAASAPTSARVPWTRLARISSLYAAVQRRGHVRPGQVHDGVEAVQRAGGEPARGGERIPGDLVRAGRCPSDQPDHPVAAAAQGGHQGGSDQAR